MKLTIKLLSVYMTKVAIVGVYLILSSCSQKQLSGIEFIGGTNFSLGSIKCDDIAICSFQYKNLNEQDLLINEVKTSCGCTVSNWSRTPLKQDSIGNIDVSYLARMPGAFDQSILIFFHGESKPIVLKINGYVLNPDIKVVEGVASKK